MSWMLAAQSHRQALQVAADDVWEKSGTLAARDLVHRDNPVLMDHGRPVDPMDGSDGLAAE